MSNEIQLLEQNSIVAAFQTENGVQSLFDRMAEQARSIIPDVSTKKGRDAIASQAYKVSKSKTAVDNHGKELVAGIKAQAAVIDKDRKAWRDQCDALRDEIRKPLDDWEQAEKDRVAKHENAIKEITDFLLPENINVDAEILASNIRYLEKVPMGTMFEEYEEKIKIAKLETLEALRAALASREKYEAEQAELERLRQAEILRQQQEREAQIAREAAEKATREAEEKARFEAERVEREKREAEQREARLKAEKEAAELRATQAAENERKRIEAEQLAQAEAARKAEDQRKANVEHMRKINNDILSALLTTGINDDQAKQIIKMIAKNEVPNVRISY